MRLFELSHRHGDWAEEGFGSCAEWLTWRIGITRNTANEKVRAARVLEGKALSEAPYPIAKLHYLSRSAFI